MFSWLKKRSATTLGLFGKIPAEGDFVRINASGPTVQAFDRWLQEAIEKARNAGETQLFTQPIRFLFRSADPKTVLAGVMLPSVDAVGRIFPISVFAAISAPSLAGKFSQLPVLLKDFLDSAHDVLKSAESQELEQLARELDELELPDVEADTDGDTLRSMLEVIRGPDAWSRLFGEEKVETRYYAFQTFGVACRSVQREDPTKSGATIDCPVASLSDVVFWLNLAQSLLSWKKAPPAFFWVDRPHPRLLLSLGPPANVVLLALSRPNLDAPKLWSLKTRDDAARDAAMSSFDAAQQQIISGENVSNEALIAALARA